MGEPAERKTGVEWADVLFPVPGSRGGGVGVMDGPRLIWEY